MTIFNSKNPAGQTVAELGLLTTLIVSGASNSAYAARQARAQRKEDRAAYKYAVELHEARGRADELGLVAMRAVRHVAALEAEVRRLKASLDQRQAFIDRMRNSNSGVSA